MFIIAFVYFGWKGGLIDNEILAMDLKFDMCCYYCFFPTYDDYKENIILRTVVVQTT